MNSSKIKSILKKELSSYEDLIPEQFFSFLKSAIRSDSLLHDRILIVESKYQRLGSFSFDKNKDRDISEKLYGQLLKIIDDIKKEDIVKETLETKILEELILRKINTNPKIIEIKEFGLDNFPQIISDYKSIQRLILSDNEITNIPDWLKDFENLSILDIRNNKIKELPEFLFYLPNLTKIDFIKNDWDYDTITLKGNPIEYPPIEILSRGIEATREYFGLINKQGGSELFEAKLLVLGAGGAGKTTLIKKLDNSEYKVPTNESTTHGVEIKNYDFDYYDYEKVRTFNFKTSIWDFGGQEIYHSTHQFFLTRKSLYLLVSDNRREDTDFDYWLYIITILSDNSPIIIVLNEKDNRVRNLDTKGLNKLFPSLKEVVNVNFSNNKGLQTLIYSVQYCLASLGHVGEKLPAKWVNIRKRLESIDKNYISINDFYDICAEEEILEESQVRFISQYLHDLGVILHFQNDVLLDNIIILNPEWATHAVYKVLDSEKVIQQKGSFNIKDLGLIWSDEKYPKDKHPELLNLMLKFQMCYRIENSSDLIAPQLLPVEEPIYFFPAKNLLEYQYRYEFIPKGIISKFIVKSHKNIKNEFINKLYERVKNEIVWKNGVILKYDDTEAEVIENFIHRKINIRVSGPQSKEVLFLIKEDFKNIHSTYPNIEYKELIPCSCKECINESKREYFGIDVIKNAILKGKDTIECRISFEDIPIKSLIDNINIDKFKVDNLLDLLSHSKYSEFFDNLEKKLKETILYSEFVHLSARYSQLMEENYKHTISHDQFTLTLNQIILSAQTLIKKAEKFI